MGSLGNPWNPRNPRNPRNLRNLEQPMTDWTRAGVAILAATLIAVTGPIDARQGPPADPRLPDYDIRDARPPAPVLPGAAAAVAAGRARPRHERPRVDPRTGALRVLTDPVVTLAPRANAAGPTFFASHRGGSVAASTEPMRRGWVR